MPKIAVGDLEKSVQKLRETPLLIKNSSQTALQLKKLFQKDVDPFNSPDPCPK